MPGRSTRMSPGRRPNHDSAPDHTSTPTRMSTIPPATKSAAADDRSSMASPNIPEERRPRRQGEDVKLQALLAVALLTMGCSDDGAGPGGLPLPLRAGTYVFDIGAPAAVCND